MKFWNRVFAGQKPRSAGVRVANVTAPFAMQRTGDEAEIVLYGDIVREQPTNWWGEPIEGQYIILSEFLEELKKVEDVARLTVRIHSAGGNAYDAMVIHNRLKSLSAEITVIVDGVAMSGGSLIMCAGDLVQVYPGSLVMIHLCWSVLWDSYNAEQLRKMADANDAVDRSQAAIYQAKTGMGQEELLAMMADETYMTGQEAVDFGFADELVEGSSLSIAASADRKTLFVGALPVWVSGRKDGIPAVAHIKTVNTEAFAAGKAYHNTLAKAREEHGGRTMAKNLEELRMENPALLEALLAEASAQMRKEEAQAAEATGAVAQTSTDNGSTAQAGLDPVAVERARLQAIDEVAGLFDEETIRAAKYGEKPCSAQDMVYQAAQRATKQGSSFLAALGADNLASGAQQIGAATHAAEEGANGAGALSPAQIMAKGRADAKALSKKEKGDT